MAYRYAIFDLDGTLLDTLSDLRNSMNHVLSTHGFPERSIDEIRRFVGNGIRKLCERAVPLQYKDDDALIDKIFAEMGEYYNKHCKEETAPYPGMIEAVKTLKENGYACAIVSNKLDSTVKELHEFYFDGIFDAAIGETPDRKRKPEPDMVYAAMKEIGADKEHSVYIGDSDVDFMTAKNSGLPCISVLWGFRDREFLEEHGAYCFAKDSKELTDILLGMFTR